MKRWKRFYLFSHFWKIWLFWKGENKFSVTWFSRLLLKRQTTGRNAEVNLGWMNNVEYFFLAALNPIRSLIRVMHRDFTLQVGFFWMPLGSRNGLKLDRAWLKAGLFNVAWGVLCPGESLKLSGEQRWSFPLFWRRGREIIWHCCWIGFSGGTNYLISHKPFLYPLFAPLVQSCLPWILPRI